MTHSEYIKRRDEIIEGCDISNNQITPISNPQQAIDQLILDVIDHEYWAEYDNLGHEELRQTQRTIITGEVEVIERYEKGKETTYSIDGGEYLTKEQLQGDK